MGVWPYNSALINRGCRVMHLCRLSGSVYCSFEEFRKPLWSQQVCTWLKSYTTNVPPVQWILFHHSGHGKHCLLSSFYYLHQVGGSESASSSGKSILWLTIEPSVWHGFQWVYCRWCLLYRSELFLEPCLLASAFCSLDSTFRERKYMNACELLDEMSEKRTWIAYPIAGKIISWPCTLILGAFFSFKKPPPLPPLKSSFHVSFHPYLPHSTRCAGVPHKTRGSARVCDSIIQAVLVDRLRSKCTPSIRL